MKKRVAISAIATIAAIGNLYKDAYVFGKNVAYREKFHNEGLDEFDSIRIKNHRGLLLQGYLLDNHANQTLVILHPFDSDSSGMKKYVDYFMNLLSDVNVLLVDALAHGNSDGYVRGFGYKDVTDLMFWNEYLLQRFGREHSIIMYGREMGANTILNTAGLNKLKNVKLIISEGAYDCVSHYLGYKFAKNENSMHLVIPAIRQAFLNEVKMDISKMDSVKFVKGNSIPTLFIHSQNDKNVYFNSVLNLYNNNKSDKELFPIKVEHLYDVNINDKYLSIVKDFIKQYR